MVIVIVSEEHVVNFADARAFGRSQNPVRIAAIVVWPAGIDQQGLSSRGDKQCGLATLDVNEVSAQILLRSPRDRPSKKGKQDDRKFPFAYGTSHLFPQNCSRSEPCMLRALPTIEVIWPT